MSAGEGYSQESVDDEVTIDFEFGPFQGAGDL